MDAPFSLGPSGRAESSHWVVVISGVCVAPVDFFVRLRPAAGLEDPVMGPGSCLESPAEAVGKNSGRGMNLGRVRISSF